MNDTQKHKASLLKELYYPYQRCTLCPLAYEGRNTIVFGSGNPDAKLLFVGEAPGKEEDLNGAPFVGASGRLLTRILDQENISRDDVFITNSVKCRPRNNRKPTFIEVGICTKELLQKQIAIISPRVVCTLGAIALEAILQKSVHITKIRGTPFVGEKYTLIPTFHPAYALRFRAAIPLLQQDIRTAIALSNNPPT